MFDVAGLKSFAVFYAINLIEIVNMSMILPLFVALLLSTLPGEVSSRKNTFSKCYELKSSQKMVYSD